MKEGSQKSKSRTQGVDSNKASRHCSQAQPGTLAHDLPSSSYSSRRRYQVCVSTAAVEPPLPKQVNENRPRLLLTAVVRGLRNSGSTYY